MPDVPAVLEAPEAVEWVMPTLFEIAKDIRITANSREVLGDRIVPVPFDTTPGYRIVPPEALASLLVPVVNYNPDAHAITGFQRILSPFHARQIARDILAGREMPPGQVSIDEEGLPIISDGQHCSVGSMLAGVGLAIVVEARPRWRAQQLFADQKRGVVPSNDYLILAGSGPYNEYVQDALTNDNNPWAAIVGPGKYLKGPGSTTKISPTQMHVLLTQYVGNQTGTQQNRGPAGVLIERWDERLADELAPLVACFGTRQTNPDAFKGNSLRAIGATATLAIRRRGSHTPDKERWIREMPKFPFGRYVHLGSTGLTDNLIAHWNKRLRDDRRIARPRSGA
jgi:hypothetical protein